MQPQLHYRMSSQWRWCLTQLRVTLSSWKQIRAQSLRKLVMGWVLERSSICLKYNRTLETPGYQTYQFKVVKVRNFLVSKIFSISVIMKKSSVYFLTQWVRHWAYEPTNVSSRLLFISWSRSLTGTVCNHPPVKNNWFLSNLFANWSKLKLCTLCSSFNTLWDLVYRLLLFPLLSRLQIVNSL